MIRRCKMPLNVNSNTCYSPSPFLPFSTTVNMKIFFALLICFIFSFSVFAQQTKKIDHLTIEEDDLIHGAQELDKRMEVFVKAIDRRFLALNGTSEVKEKKKEAEKWGALPTGTRAELLGDIKSILEEAVRNIDNAAEHDMKNPLLPKSLKILAGGCSRFVTQLKPFYDNSTDSGERASAYNAIQTCREVVEAQANKGESASKQ